MRFKYAYVALVLFTLLAGLPAQAQITGQVVDPSGQGISSAVVNISRVNPSWGGYREYVGYAFTDANGDFSAVRYDGTPFEDGRYLLEADGWQHLTTRVVVQVAAGAADAGAITLQPALQGVQLDATYERAMRTVYWTVLVDGRPPARRSPYVVDTLVSTPALTEMWTWVPVGQPTEGVRRQRYLNRFSIPAGVPAGFTVCGSVTVRLRGEPLDVRSNNHGWCLSPDGTFNTY